MDAKNNHERWRSHRDAAKLRLMWRRIALWLSLAVILGVGYGLSMPAITMSTSNQQIEEATPSESADTPANGEASVTAQDDAEVSPSSDETDSDVSEQEGAEKADGERTRRHAAAPTSDEEAVIDQTDAEWIFDKLSLRKKAFSETDWTEVSISEDNVAIVGADDELEVTMQELEIPAGTLDESRSAVRYKLPDVFVFDEELSGKLKHDDTKLGTWKIDKEGVVTLTFKSKTARKNADGDPILCDLTFTTHLQQEKTRDAQRIAVTFAEDHVFTLQLAEMEENTNTLAPNDVSTNPTVADATDNAEVASDEPAADVQTELDPTEEGELEPDGSIVNTITVALSDLIAGTMPQDTLLLASKAQVNPEVIVKSVSLKKKAHIWDNVWTDVNIENGSITSTDILQFTLNYQVPGHILNDGHRFVEYTLPDILKISQETSGYVRHNNEVVGEYVIGTDGKIKITFDDEYEHRNEAGEAIVGDITFTAMIDDEKIPTDNDNQVQVHFSDTLTMTLSVQPSENSGKGNLKVSKSASHVDAEKGTLNYRLQVYSNEGTSSDITLTDILSGTSLDGELTVYYQDPTTPWGSTTNYTVQQKDDGGFTLTFPKMPENSQYVVEYKAKTNSGKAPIRGQLVDNTATATSTNNQGQTIGDRVELETLVRPNLLSKRQTAYDPTNELITWEVVVNDSKRDIGGWTLEDVLNGEAYNGTVQISPAINGQSTISLPYTFPEGTNQRYTITYQTEAVKVLGANRTSNTAVLRKDGERVTANASFDSPNDNPMSKVSTGVTESTDHKTATIQWELTIDTSKTTLPEDWVLVDEPGGNQYYTGQQLLDMKAALDAALAAADYHSNYVLEGRNSSYQYVAVDANQTYQAFKLTFTDKLPRNKILHLSYESTAKVEGITKETTFTNRAHLNNYKAIADGNATFKPSLPTIEKTDADGNAKDSTHAIAKADDPFAWHIKLNIPGGYSDGDLRVIEHLPAGVQLKQLDISAEGVFEGSHHITAAGTHQVNGYAIQTSISDQNITITIPEALAQAARGKHIDFDVKVQVKENFQWGIANDIPSSQFTNTVELRDKDNQDLGRSSQSQTINVENGDPNAKVVSKTASTMKDGVLPYNIEVNLTGEDLVPGSDVITLTDVLSFEENPDWLVALFDLAPKSVHVYHANPDGSKGAELTSDEYAYIYKKTPRRTTDWRDPNHGTATSKRTLTFTLPDETPLIVSYQYIMDGKITDKHLKVTVSNTVEIDGFAGNRDHSETVNQWDVVDSQAHASTEGIVLYKVDSTNHAKHLAGAVFELYAYNEATGDYTDQITKKAEDGTTISRFVTGKQGDLEFPELAYNQAYKLVEISAPNGYKITKGKEDYRFIFVEKVEKADSNLIKPDDFTQTGGETLEAGDYLSIGNEPIESLTIEKKWLASDGKEKTVTSGNIQVQLEQGTKNAQTGDVSWSDYREPITITYDSAKKWRYTIDDLPEIDDNEQPYFYRVREIPQVQWEGYDVSYSANNDKGIRSGSITITNSEKQTYTLPSTGGVGTNAYTIGGISLLLAAAALWIYRKHNQWKGAM